MIPSVTPMFQQTSKEPEEFFAVTDLVVLHRVWEKSHIDE